MGDREVGCEAVSAAEVLAVRTEKRAAALNAEAALAWIERAQAATASARRWLAVGKPGLARIATLYGDAETLSLRPSLATLIAAFEELRPGLRRELRPRALALARTLSDPTFPAEFRAGASAANSAELYALLLQDAADRGDRELVAEAMDGLVDAALKTARALEAAVRDVAVRGGRRHDR